MKTGRKITAKIASGVMAILLTASTGAGLSALVSPVTAEHEEIIYEDALGSQWTDWSWNASRNLDNPAPVKSGNRSIWVKLSPWGGLYFHRHTQLNMSDFSALDVSVQATAPSTNLTLLVYNEFDQVAKSLALQGYGGEIKTSGYSTFSIPVSDLGTGLLKGIALQDGSGTGQAPIFVDSISLKPRSASSSPAKPIEPSDPPSNIGQSGYTAGANKIYRDGNVITLRGINWFGSETDTLAPHGLWSRSYKDMISQIKNLGFNAVRLPVNPASINGSAVNGIDYTVNPELTGKNSIQVLDEIISEMGQQGLYVLLDHHRPDNNAISELWYTPWYSEQQWIADLVSLATRYRTAGNVIGIDLKNEPHGAATWGTGNTATDWNLAAERAGKQVLAANPNILVFVEGIGENPSCSSSIPHGWGNNLEPVKCTPISTSAIPANKLVLSPHMYGPDVYSQPYFYDSSFPSNMAGVWETHFGYLTNNPAYTIIPGEWGGKFGNAGGNPMDPVLQQALMSYFTSKGICNSFYWSFNPNSGDTGGILQDDWSSVWQNKVSAIGAYHSACTSR
ncbi:MAG: glycoside hydrolase family 5 protein [Candidatus Dojkabacteria bacterium]|nr:glycoside hydrolase family 5 protein [Candidatus Dojkabacteria bacterium]